MNISYDFGKYYPAVEGHFQVYNELLSMRNKQ